MRTKHGKINNLKKPKFIKNILAQLAIHNNTFSVELIVLNNDEFNSVELIYKFYICVLY